MTQAEQIHEMLRQKPYRSLNSPRLKPTPDLAMPPTTVDKEEVEEARLLLTYEQQLEEIRTKRGY